jgi:hypothetical protein
MTLPQIAVPKFKLKLPSNGKDIYYRPFLVKEEKTLLMAVEGGEDTDITESVINIIEACVDYDGNVRELPFFDIEYIFVNLRSRSINNILNLKLRHASGNSCQHITDYELNLEDVKVDIPKDHTKNIQLTDDVGLVLKYPSLESVNVVSESMKSSKIDNIFNTLASQVESVYDAENVYEDFTHEEMVDYIGNLNKEQFFKVVNFFEKLPTVSYDVKYTCSECGENEHIPMKGLQSFFM